jgi:ubiquinone/menaquinone biosynthesis C-methylase UbiE
MISLANRFLVAVLRFFFYLLYNPLAWSYDWVAAVVSLNQWQAWIRCPLPYLTGERILELGHGPGHLQAAMNQPGRQVFGLDLSRAMGAQAKRKLDRLSLPIRLVRARAQQLPFAANAFNQIVATFPTEYLYQPQTLSEIYRVLAPDGLVVVIPVAWIHRGSRIESSLAWLFQITHQSPPQEDDRWQTRMIKIFQQAGFAVRTQKVPQRSSEVFLLLADKSKLL